MTDIDTPEIQERHALEIAILKAAGIDHTTVKSFTLESKVGSHTQLTVTHIVLMPSDPTAVEKITTKYELVPLLDEADAPADSE